MYVQEKNEQENLKVFQMSYLLLIFKHYVNAGSLTWINKIVHVYV